MSRTFHHSMKHGKRHRMNLPVNYFGKSPGWWVRIFMNRPKRHDDARLLAKVAAGTVDADSASYAVGNRRPHVYYW